MKNVAGHIETVMLLFKAGFLCKCSGRTIIEVLDEDYNLVEDVIISHDTGCVGRDKVKHLLEMD